MSTKPKATFVYAAAITFAIIIASTHGGNEATNELTTVPTTNRITSPRLEPTISDKLLKHAFAQMFTDNRTNKVNTRQMYADFTEQIDGRTLEAHELLPQGDAKKITAQKAQLLDSFSRGML